MIAARERVGLRRLEPSDLDYLYRWENDPEVWQYGDCGAESILESSERFSRRQLLELIENQQYCIDVSEQLRLVVCRRDDDLFAFIPVGFIDIFDFDPEKLSAGVGILICDPADRRLGYGGEALVLLAEYARRELGMQELWCTIDPGNFASIALFSGAGFNFICDDDRAREGEMLLLKKLLD
jgi:diamine N-acetyltransferase